jgi:pimeloyl-ACP methyl ester carboxylesterase
MPSSQPYNGNLVIWAHGFQDAGTPVGIPEDQLCQTGFCIPGLVNGLGFAFATNSYSKTGMAIVQGRDDILDLVRIFSETKGTPHKVYLIGASEGGIITALSVEQHPDVFAAGVAACGPIGSFPGQINYFGDGRALFQVFFPGVIPGDPFNPPAALVSNWSAYYDQVVRPILLNPVNRPRLDAWVATARLPYDPANYLPTVEQSARDVLRYSVVNLVDAAVTIGGFPYGNTSRWYTGTGNDPALNALVPRVSADASALQEMAQSYSTTGVLQRPLITLHTTRDQQVPYWHEQLYALKTAASGSFLTRHLPIRVDRYGHCQFTAGEALVSFALMLFYDASLQEVSGVATTLSGADLTTFETRARDAGLPYRVSGSRLQFKLKR